MKKKNVISTMMQSLSYKKKIFFFAIGFFALAQVLIYGYSGLGRALSIYLGDGKCKWTPPVYDPAPDDYFKTLVTGYPGGSKRIMYSYIEAMAGIAFNDEWALATNNPNRPFVKGNYPHHEGIWGYGNDTNQVIMLMRNPLHAIIEYHAVLYDIDFAADVATAVERSENLYLERPTVESWREWRDLRLPAEIHWYGWFIDYWMEGGLLRDISSHDLATSEYWNKMYITPGPYYESGTAFKGMVGEGEVTKEYDLHCINDMQSGSCAPALVASYEKLIQKSTGPVEMLSIANVLNSKPGISVIDDAALPCIWDELMVEKKGVHTQLDRAGGSDNDFKFKLPMLTEMLSELSRLKTKYSTSEWATKDTAKDLVNILEEYITDINSQIEFGNYE